MQYKVKALTVGGKNNKIYHSGDIVTSNHFPEGNAKKLVSSGHLIELDANEPDTKSAVSKQLSFDSNDGKNSADSTGPQKSEKITPEKSINDYSKKQLIDLVKYMDGFQENMSKTEMFNLLLKK
jgi:hypothetical protein